MVRLDRGDRRARRSPGPAPSDPSRLPLEALTLTASRSSPRSAAIASRIASEAAPSRGRAAMIVRSMLAGRQPAGFDPAADRRRPAARSPRPRRPVVGREEASEIAQRGRPEQGVGHGVEDDVAVGVAGQRGAPGIATPPRCERCPGPERMAVVADARSASGGSRPGPWRPDADRSAGSP